MNQRKGTRIILGAIVLLVLIGCSKKDNNIDSVNEEQDIVTLRALTIGVPPSGGMDIFYQQLDALTIPDLGCVVRFDYIPWGDERKQINIAIAAGEYDFIPGGVFSDYQSMAAKNAFINLYDYMKAVPNLESHYKLLRENYLSNFEIGGKLYGLPQYGKENLYGIDAGFFYREDLRKEWGLEPIKDFKTMEAYLYRAKADPRYLDYPLVTDNRIWTCLWYMLTGDKYLELSSALDNPFVVVSSDNPMEPINRFETSEFKEVLKIVKKWYDDGILESSILASSSNEGTLGLEMMKLDQKPCETNNSLWSVTNHYIPELYEVHPDWEFGFYNYTSDNFPSYRLDNIGITVISISSKSNYPELAIRFLEKVHTNQEYFDLVNYGVEGIHYNIIDNYLNYSGIEVSDQFNGMTGAPDVIMDYTEKSINTAWQSEVIDKVNENKTKLLKNAPDYPLNGFNYNASKVSDIYKSMEVIRLKNMQPLCCGATDNLTENYDFAIQLLKEAGVDDYINDVREQLKEFSSKSK